MSDGVVVAIITSSGAIFLALLNIIAAALERKRTKKIGIEQRLDAIDESFKKMDEKFDKLSNHNELQYLSILRLTVMDSDMPMSERLIAGKDYLNRGGNGDVKKYYESLERKVNQEKGVQT